jgi:hypothetical protein
MFYSELNFVIRKKGGSNFVKDRWANVRNEMGIEMQLKQEINGSSSVLTKGKKIIGSL